MTQIEDAFKRNYQIRVGGLMRCCLASLNEKCTELKHVEGEVFPCLHCTSSMVFRDGAWEWLADPLPKGEASDRPERGTGSPGVDEAGGPSQEQTPEPPVESQDGKESSQVGVRDRRRSALREKGGKTS